jgi:hypothetical protein
MVFLDGSSSQKVDHSPHLAGLSEDFPAFIETTP